MSADNQVAQIEDSPRQRRDVTSEIVIKEKTSSDMEQPSSSAQMQKEQASDDVEE